MKATGLIGIVCCVAAWISAAGEATGSSDVANSPNLRIVGGNVVRDKKYEWQVSLQSGGEHICGGTLIAEKWVLTAAHCFDDTDLDSVVLGVQNLRSKDLIRVPIRRRIAHPRYRWFDTKHDIGLVELAKRVTNIPVIRLPSKPNLQVEKAGTKTIVTGWGATRNDGYGVNDLREVIVPIVSYETCTAPGSYSKREIYSTNICAGYLAGGKDSCQGDSGGPLFTLMNDNNGADAVQVGVVSWGDQCAKKRKYGVYTQVSKYMSWLKKVMRRSKAGLQIYSNKCGCAK